ncbi:hypothetical protein IT072_16915 [Leifsonia sp. ZF2019]|uniref:hypothetical protein n=1 Tax=Leifsonia sp. ZF2019 TaxID=2781978 RepID=UPI001CBE9F83|nr:hypothetical protein [Leifsonia sp. ZF2019]UAJ78884.1 hypothetical protein IT072_16915 [Leifsonia sp. ZF2019]
MRTSLGGRTRRPRSVAIAGGAVVVLAALGSSAYGIACTAAQARLSGLHHSLAAVSREDRAEDAVIATAALHSQMLGATLAALDAESAGLFDGDSRRRVEEAETALQGARGLTSAPDKEAPTALPPAWDLAASLGAIQKASVELDRRSREAADTQRLPRRYRSIESQALDLLQPLKERMPASAARVLTACAPSDVSAVTRFLEAAEAVSSSSDADLPRRLERFAHLAHRLLADRTAPTTAQPRTAGAASSVSSR